MRIIEAGHYYLAHGPTRWSKMGVTILSHMQQPGDVTLLFVDDIHTADEVPPSEKNEPVIPHLAYQPDFILYESAFRQASYNIIDNLKRLPKRIRARQNKQSGRWFCGNVPLTTSSGDPTCTLYDVALTLWKSEQAKTVINILPEHYRSQQLQVISVLKKLGVPIIMEIRLFNNIGKVTEIIKQSFV